MKTLSVIAMMAACAVSAWAAGTPCEGLAKLTLPHVEITGATVVAKGAFTPPPGGGPGGPGGGRVNPIFATLPSFCRVTATLRPSADSDIKIEVWIPVEGFTGRLQAFGNGGFGSNIGYANLAQGVEKGYAATASNTGHEGNGANFAFGHPEKVKDWEYRAVHEMTVAAKAIIAAQYGSGPKYSYWNACSTGGRQGLVAAENYPKDFDGLAIGDPADPMSRLQAGSIWTNVQVNKDAASYITPAKWAVVHNAVMNQCDAVDGLKDGLIENPLACKFDIQQLACKNGDAADCLTAPQVEALGKVVSGAVNPRTGKQIYPGWPVATQMSQGPVVGPKPQQDAIDTFRVLFDKSDWDFHTMDFDKDIALSDKLGNGTMNAVDETKLRALFAHGGKILMYHGWTDPNITPLISIDLYSKAVAANGGKDKASNEIRLFMVPGMNHCGGGDGPNAFDKMEPLTEWVEHGKAPERIVASHSNAAGEVDRTRPLCPYPQVARYKGTGSVDEAQNFACVAP